ncbi:hypothetical protein V3C99_016565 [Haemonchus contortus]
MCGNNFYEFQKANTSYSVILPDSYAPLTLPMISHGYPAFIESESAEPASSSTAPVAIPNMVPRAFPESGSSFGSLTSYGKAGLAC